jgi:hypothetical protein
MILIGKIALGIAGTVVAGVGLLCSEGMVEVNVVERQPEAHHIFVMAPAMLMPIGMNISRHWAPQGELSRAAAEIRPWMPTIRAALDQLRDSEDITFVEVKEPGEHVRVAKSGGSIVVDVEDHDNTVHVSTPIRAISSTIEQLAAAAPTT